PVLIGLFIGGIVVYLLQINFYKDLLNSLGSLVGGRLQYLINQAAGGDETSYGISFGIIEKVLMYFAMILFYSKLKNYNPLIINACFIFILIYLGFSTSQSFINRFSSLFLWGYILTYSYLLEITSRK